MTEMINAEHHKAVAGHVATEDITFGYCTEIMIGLKQGPTYVKDFDYEEFQNYLSNLGDSLLVVNDDEIVKVHVHTEDPGLVMQEGLKYGALVKVKVENMRNQHDAQVQKQQLFKLRLLLLKTLPLLQLLPEMDLQISLNHKELTM